MSKEHTVELSFSVAEMVAGLQEGTFDPNAGPGIPTTIGNRWHYHFFEPTWDARYMRCAVPECGVVHPTCQHEYQSYGPSFHWCKCGDTRRVPGAGIYGEAEARQPIEGDE